MQLSQEKRRAWWRWHFAGLLMAARVAVEGESHEQSALQAAAGAEALILELEGE